MIFNYLFLNKKFYFYYFNGKFIDKINRKKIDLYYIGEYRKGIKHGYGKLYNKSGNLLFVGIYNNGNKCKGKEYQDNNIIFYGEYKDGKRYNGKGKEYNDDGELVFEGEYKEGKRYNGKGKQINYYGEIIFEGEYKDGKRYNGKEYNGGIIFEGEYKDGKKYKGKEYNYYGKLIIEDE